jgi:hypothetical protein
VLYCDISKKTFNHAINVGLTNFATFGSSALQTLYSARKHLVGSLASELTLKTASSDLSAKTAVQIAGIASRNGGQMSIVPNKTAMTLTLYALLGVRCALSGTTQKTLTGEIVMIVIGATLASGVNQKLNGHVLLAD